MHSGFRTQIESLQEQLGRLREYLARLPAAGQSPGFTQAHGTLTRLTEAQLAQCKSFARRSASRAGEREWSELASLRTASRDLAADYLALQDSVRLRSEPRIRQICSIADSLLAGLSNAVSEPRSHYTLISEAEHFGGSSPAIHLGFVDLSVWTLTRLAHEFAHMWLTDSRRDGLRRDFLAEVPSSWSQAHGHEFFADIFATFLLGPAYAFSSLLLDFDPAERNSSRAASHPTGNERARCVLWTLRHLAESHPPLGQPEFHSLHDSLDASWSAARSQAVPTEQLIEGPALELMVLWLFERLQTAFPQSMYNRIPAANRFRSALDSPSPVSPPDTDWRDALNGAWFWRRSPQTPPGAAEIEARLLRVVPRLEGVAS